MERRAFVKSLGIMTSSALLPGTTFAANETELFAFEKPFDGAILHERLKSPVLGPGNDSKRLPCLKIEVSGYAPENATVEIIGPRGEKPAVTRNGRRFSAPVALTEKFSTIKATCNINGKPVTITTRPVWIKNSFKRFRFQIDDNSFFLRDIHQKKYKNIFECFYLDGLRKLHEKYGAKFVLNCFYSTPEKDFDLSMMSDQYKSQWNDNADWLRLAFHAKNEFPDWPYEKATSEELAADFDLVAGHLRRIAGNAYTPPGIIHFGTAPRSTHHVLRERGSRCLSCYFVQSAGKWIVSFLLPDKICEYGSKHDAWFDHDSGIVFSKLEMVCNSVPLDKTVPLLQNAIDDPNTAEVIDLLTHEQYFWPYYKNYIPDHFQRLDAAIHFVVDHGYRPVWHNDGFYSVPE